jgi:superfamily II DNA or RNA helicase/HKD family nuclease
MFAAAPSQVLNLPSTGSMAQVLSDALRAADVVAVSVAFVQMTGLQLLLNALCAARARGARARVLTSTYFTTTEPQALRALAQIPGLELRVQDGAAGFHTKAHLFVSGDSRCVWVGSTNWSRGGLRDNVEWNARVDDPRAVTEAWQHFEDLWRRDDVRKPDPDFLDAYSARWTAQQLRAAIEAPRGVAEVSTTYGAAPEPTALQRDALQRLRDQRADGVTRALVVAATGVGKTLLAAFDAHTLGATRVLFVAHRKDIVVQAARAFGRVFGASFSPEVLVEGARSAGGAAVFVTIQALLGAGGAALLGREWEYVIVDEFHHAEAEGWKRMLRGVRADFLLGLTATPERADGRNVMDLCDGNVAYEVRLPEAIRRRALVPFHYFGVADETVDYGALPRRPSEADLGRALSLTARADLVLHHARAKGFDGVKRVAVGFCAGIQHATFMRDAFTALGECAAHVDGSTPTGVREDLYARLQDPSDPLQWLFVADVLNEGVDLPAINTVLFLRPTESPVVFLQQLGRGLRKHPGTEVLTVIDLVGLHRGAFDALRALHDEHAAPTPESLRISRALLCPITPPEGCEILLEDRTLEVLEKVRHLAVSRRDRTERAYELLRGELGRPPRPLDGLRVDALSLASVRASHGDWRALRVAMNDAAPWEHAVQAGDPLDRLLRVAARNQQLQRVEGYAALWALLDDDPAAAFERFFAEQPRWRAEQSPRTRDEVIAAARALLERADAGELYTDRGWALTLTDDARVAVRERLSATLESDYQLRHGGVLRAPSELQRFVAYTRPEVMHHFGEQYDPTVHNRGVISARRHPTHHILLARADNRAAKAEHQYENRVLDRQSVLWTSQNQMRPDNTAGAIIAKQREHGVRLHLFFAPASHTPYRYLGEVNVSSFEGAAPMRVKFSLAEVMPEAVFDELTRGGVTSVDG